MSPSADTTLQSRSIPIADEEIRQDGCFSSLPVRKSTSGERCDEALQLLLKDWAVCMRDGREKTTSGIENPISGNWIALVVPDCLPERLGLLTYITNIVFLHDDAAEATSAEEAHESLNSEFIAGLAEKLSRRNSLIEDAVDSSAPAVQLPSGRPVMGRSRNFSTIVSPMQRLLEPWVKKLLACDRDLGLEVLEAWRKYYNEVDTKEAEDLDGLAEYIPYRIMDFGSGPWLVMVRFGMGLHLTEQELESVERIVEAALKSAALTNDYWSWPKEKAGLDATKSRLMNGVSFAIKDHGFREAQARDHIKSLAIDAEQEYLRLTEKYVIANTDAKTDVHKYLLAVGFFAAGKSLWSSTCPRYNKHRNLS